MNSADYPRMLFHRQKEPVIVQSEAEEAALGAEWSRIVIPPSDVQEPPPAEYPPEWVPPEPEPLPEEPEEPEKHPEREPEKRRRFRKA